MSQRITNSFINTNIPGSYFDTKVKSTPVGVSVSGNIAIIGEADGGADFSSENLKDNFFTPDQLDRVQAKYTSGNIVDSFRALVSASNDADITGSANRIYIVKTNAGQKAEADVDTSYGTLTDKNYGLGGNNYNYLITNTEDEAKAQATGSTIASLGAALDEASFSVRVSGSAATVITLSAVAADHDTIAELAAEIDAQLPSGLECAVGTASNSLVIRTETDASANTRGYGKSIELIDSTPGDLAALGLVAGLSVSSQEPEIQVDIKRADTGLNESFIVKAEVALLIGYQGTTATLTISSSNILTTTIAGGSGANLSIDLTNYATLTDLAGYIAAQTGYSCSVAPTSSQLSPTLLDKVSAIGICSTSATLKPGRVKKAASNFQTKLAQSTALDFEATALLGLPIEMSVLRYLSGGTKGGTLAADVVSAVDSLEGIDVNFVVPLFSRDASEDIAESLTDSSSTYTIDAVNALVKSHILKMSTAKVKKHRQAFLSFWGSFSDAQDKAGELAHYRTSLCFQKASRASAVGTTEVYLPWMEASIAAGMQAAGFYKAIVNKFANVISFTDPSDFDSGSIGDQETALSAGLLFLKKDIVGNKWVSDQTTYGVDTNFVYNSIQAVYAADLVSLDLADSFDRAFVGKSLADVDASAALGFLQSKMFSYKQSKLIAASDDAPLGFRNAKVTINGPIMEVSVEIKLATALYFIPISIEISQITTTASI